MSKRVIHQDYLEFWLNGGDIEIKIDHGTEGESAWCDFKLETFQITSFNKSDCYFRRKLVAVDVLSVFREIDNLSHSHVDGVLYLEDVRMCLSRHIYDSYEVVSRNK